MMSIFSDIAEEVMEIFMDDFTVYGSSFEQCLHNLGTVLQRCKDKNLALNWEKCHFMVTEGIVLGHMVSAAGLEVDQAKVSIIRNLMPPTTVKGIRSFLGHAGFYRRFIRDFSKISRPLCRLLEKDTKFYFDESCHNAFEEIKSRLVEAPIMAKPDWNREFEIMCDASDFAMGAVLGQKDEKVFKAIYYCHTPIPGPTRLADPNRFPGRETIYWDSLPDFFLKAKWHLWVWSTSYNNSKHHIHLQSPIYNYKTVLLHLQIRARNLHVVNPYKCVGPTVCGNLQMSSPVPTRIKTRAKLYA